MIASIEPARPSPCYVPRLRPCTERPHSRNNGVDVTRRTAEQRRARQPSDCRDRDRRPTGHYEMVAHACERRVLAPLLRAAAGQVSLRRCAIGTRPVDLHLTTLAHSRPRSTSTAAMSTRGAPRGLTGNRTNCQRLGRDTITRCGGGARPRREPRIEGRARAEVAIRQMLGGGGAVGGSAAKTLWSGARHAA